VYLRVRGFNGAGGNYTLAYRYQTAGCLASTSYGSITAPTDNIERLINNCTYARDYNTIYSVVSGQTYRFRSSNSGDYLTLTDASNNILTAGPTPITWTATFDGNVRLHVHTNSSCGTSSTCRSTYIQCTTCPAPACVSCPSFDFTLTPTNFWQTHTGSHPANGCKIYKVSVTAGRTYTFKTGCGDGATADYDTYLEILDNASCALLEGDNDGCEDARSLLSWTASYTGDAYVRVRGNAGAGGTYTLAYIVGTAGSIQSGSPSILVRVYPTLSEGEVWVEVRQALELPIQITVYDARGREVYRADFPAMQQLRTSLRVREAGMYLIRVSSGGFEHTERVLVIR